MRTMYDSVSPANIPATAQLVAGYVDGRYAWHAADWARFPASVKVRIAVFASTNDGHVLDVETGDATPTQAPAWVTMRRAAGVDPTVYCSLSWWPTVRAAFQAQGVREPHYWVAAYPGNGPQLYAGAIAHQYADPGPYDLSVVVDYWPGVDTIPTGNVVSGSPGTLPTPPGSLTTTPPTAAQEDDMTPDQSAALDEVRGNAQNILNGVKTLLDAIGTQTDGPLHSTHAGVDLANAKLDNVTNGVLGLLGRSPGAVAVLSSDDLAAIAKAVADEQARRGAMAAGLTLKAQ